MIWPWFALLTAVFTSMSEVVSKRCLAHMDEVTVGWGMIFFSLFFLVPALWGTGIPPLGPHFLVALLLNTIFTIVTLRWYLRAIKLAPLSASLPILSMTPLFLLIMSPLILHEFPTPLGLLGVLFIVVGSYLLNFEERHRGWSAPFLLLFRQEGARLMLGVAFLWSIAGNIDKVGVLNASPVFWLVSVHFLVSVLMLPWLGHDARKRYLAVRKNLFYFIMLGGFVALAFLFQMVALTLTVVPYVIAIKRTSILMSVLWGRFLFKEYGVRQRFAAALVMVIGSALILWG